MNERIEKLAVQAGCKVMDDGEWYIPSAAGLEKIVNTQGTGLEKFAELIVDQMLDITDAHTEVFQTDRDRALIEHIKQSVKTHFGVEE